MEENGISDGKGTGYEDEDRDCMSDEGTCWETGRVGIKKSQLVG